MKFFLLSLILLCHSHLFAQVDSLQNASGLEDFLESFFQGTDNEDDFDYNDLLDELAYLRRQPLDLNNISQFDLDLFPFLSPVQKAAYFEYLQEFGPLVSEYELQAIPHFDLPTIRRLLPFVKIGQKNLDPISENWFAQGNHQILLRWSQTLETKRGFLRNADGVKPFAGDPNALFFRYRFTYNDRISFGLTAEKDEGETFFQKDNKQGFDFYSAHFFLQNNRGKLKNLALGDYSVSMGQGLILFNGFAARKGPTNIQTRRSGRPLRRYSSVNEWDFFRGAAASVSLPGNLLLTSFISSKKQDANIEIEEDAPDDEPLAAFASSLLTSGKHRTGAELADEKAIRVTSTGAILRWGNRSSHLAGNVLYQVFDKPLARNTGLYNRFFFNGDRLLNTSLDYSHTWRNVHFFGETAISSNGAVSTVNSLVSSLDPKLDVSLLHRHFPKNYHALNAKPFAETTGAANEQGLYFGLEARPHFQWTFLAYFDLWKHPWLRFRTDAPSSGQEWLARLTYTVRRKLEAHIQIRNEVKAENKDSPDGRHDQVFSRQNLQGRIHFSYNLTKSLQWRNRFYAGFTELDGERLAGIAFFQDLRFDPAGGRFSLTARYALFDTNGFGIRFYAYENDVLNSFSIPAYSDQGSRFYLLAGWNLGNGILLEGRFARTTYTNRETVGSGNDEISGPVKTDVKLQLRWNF